ncbi:MAG: Lrp/AsnC family transcriptional regulator [Candidatus ainarchaeum sp.]|jgi:DNA-binding Lrp family transcriptional regulator|nr:Lrp/AsnC family transcriptional regulator [Candidatus ainarchaeum sp.]
MDELDYKVLSALRNNSRESFLSISKDFGVSEGTIRNRVKKLVKRGVIEKFTIDSRHNYFAFIGLKIDSNHKIASVLKDLKKIGLKKVFEVAGKFDAIIILDFMSREDANIVIDKIRLVSGVLGTETFPILNEVF